MSTIRLFKYIADDLELSLKRVSVGVGIVLVMIVGVLLAIQ